MELQLQPISEMTSEDAAAFLAAPSGGAMIASAQIEATFRDETTGLDAMRNRIEAGSLYGEAEKRAQAKHRELNGYVAAVREKFGMPYVLKRRIRKAAPVEQPAAAVEQPAAAVEQPAAVLMDQKQVCEHFGISRHTLWRWRKDGALPEPTKVGRRNRWPAEQIRALTQPSRP